MTDAPSEELSLDIPPDPTRHGDGPRNISGHQAIRDASAALASCARRELLLFGRDLDPPYYDQLPFLEAVQRLALDRHQLPVRALVMEPRLAVTHGHRLVDLARRLSSRIEIRRVGEDDRDRIDAFLVVDERGYCLRPLADRYEAILDEDGPARARRLQAEFERMWELAEPDTELRRLHL